MKQSIVVLFIIAAVLGMCIASHDFGPFAHRSARRRLRDAEEEQEEAPISFTLRVSILDDNANYTHASASFVVPELPAIIETYSEFTFALESNEINEDGSFDLLVAGLGYENETAWRAYVCACDDYMTLATCDCQYMFPNIGDVIYADLSLRDGFYIVNSTSSNGQSVAVSMSAEEVGPFGYLSSHFAGFGVENCNNLPPSNTLLFSDISLEDNGESVAITKETWTYSYSTSHCSLRAVSNEVAVRFSWNSNDWTGDRESCWLGYDEVAESSWKENGQTYTQYSVYAFNIAYESQLNISALSYSLDHQPRQLWGLTRSGDSYSLPSEALPLGFGDFHNFGYISTKRIVFTPLACEGGQRLAAGDQPEFEPADLSASPISDETGCSVNFALSPMSSWTDNGQNFTQVNVVIQNNGARAVTLLSFTPASETTFVDIWEVSTGENDYSLPSHVSPITVGGSHSFGYIASSVTDFTVGQITCS